MKSIAPLANRARRLAGAFTIAALVGGCGGPGPGSGSQPVPQPIAGDVELAQFTPSLNIHLDSMSRRADGLYVQDLVVGSGGVATLGRTVVVRYTGWLPDGKQFDAGEITVTLGSNKTIRAWEEGLLGMRVGGKRRLISPANLAYGNTATGEIPPNSVLVFEMELQSVLSA